MLKVLWQGDARWGREMLLDGPSTISRAGCVLTSLVMAARLWGDRPELSPVRLNAMAREVGACDRDRLIVHEAAPLVGLEAPLSERVEAAPGDKALRDALDRALSRPDGGALLRVSTDGGSIGRHTILATGWAPTPPKRVACADPAPATTVLLPWPDLSAVVMWGKSEKRYAVVGVRPIRRLTPTA